MIVFAKEGQSIVDVVLQYTGGLDELMHIVAANPPLTIESYPGSGTPIIISDSFVQQNATLNEIRRRSLVLATNDQTGAAPSPIPGNDPDAQNYIDALIAASYVLSSATETAINNYFLDLKGTGPNNSTYDWWTGIIRLLPFIGTTSAQQAIRAESPANSITFGGGVAHNATGIEGNGINGYYVFFDPAELTDVNDWSAWVYKRKNIAEDKWDFSAQNQTSGRQIGIRSRTASFNNLQCSAGGPFLDLQSANGSITNGAGFVGVNKYQVSGFDAYVRGVQFVKAATGFISPGIPVYGLANNRNVSAPEGYSANEHGLAILTRGIATTVEAAAFKVVNEAFMTALSRNVP